jgi:hypothetical protein
MATLEMLTVRLNLMRAYGDYLRSLSSGCQYDEGGEVLLEALAIYEHDIERRIARIEGDFGTLFILKRGIRLSVVLMEAIQETESDALKDWYYNKQPANNVEQVYGLLQQILMELSESVLGIENEYPSMKAEFDQERAEYFEQYERRKAEDLSQRFNVTMRRKDSDASKGLQKTS